VRILLIGFMGCGKSTVGKLLAARLGLPFIDLDEELEKLAGASIPEIFARRGEDAFRDLEHQALREALRRTSSVIATGGGTPVFERNWRLIERSGFSVWLDPPFTAIVDRLTEEERNLRPLFRDEDQALELYGQRRSVYKKADLQLVPEPEETPEETALKIEATLGGVE
jgi:shikimate kinase